MPGPNRFTEGLFEEADVTASVLAANGEIRYNIGDSSKRTGIDRSVQFWGIDGFLSRPNDPDAEGAAQAFFIADGNKRSIVGTRDRRYLSVLPALDPGDRVMYSPIGCSIRIDDSEQEIRGTIPEGSTFYLAPNQFRVSIANGTVIDAGLASVDVTKLGTAENVALYARLRTFLDEVQTLLEIIVGDPTALPDPIPGLATLVSVVPGGSAIATALLDQLQTVKTAGNFALNASIASSSVLRASPT